MARTDSQLESSFASMLLDESLKEVPRVMKLGSVFHLEAPINLVGREGLHIAAFSCPKCGFIALITRRQLYEKELMICGGDFCSAEWKIDGEDIVLREPQ